MNSHDSFWQRLFALARAGRDEAEIVMPLGFSTRVAALALGVDRRPVLSVVERLCWRALGVASLLAVASVATNFAPVLKAIEDEAAVRVDPVVQLLDPS